MQPDSSELSFSDLLRILRDSWLSIAVCMLAGGLSAGTAAYFSRPVYRAEVLLAPAAVQGSSSSALSRLAEQFAPLAGGAGVLGGNGGDADKEVWLATLSSRWLTESFIRARNLMPVLFSERWDPVAQQWKSKGGKTRTPTMDDAMKLFTKIRTVKEDRRTGLVTLAIEWDDPHSVADWSNDLVARVNEFLRMRAIDEARRSVSFLESELSKTTVVERQQIIYRLIESKTGDIMMANARKEYAFRIVDPAVAPEPNNFVRPHRIMVTAIGLFVGLFAGIFYVGIRWNVRRQRLEPANATVESSSRAAL